MLLTISYNPTILQIPQITIMPLIAPNGPNYHYPYVDAIDN
jgi:hypothetical protein